MTPLRVGTRASALALAQSGWVAERLSEPAELVTITTAGDVDRAAGDKSRWTGALEAALVAGEIDLAVHSAKDVPGELADGTTLLAPPDRADARDVVVGALHEGARVGTSALRRRAQLLARRPDLEVVELRGNVDTRLRRWRDGEVDALVLAAAGLQRLGLEVEAQPLDAVPAPGQGILALQARAGDERILAAAADIGHGPTAQALAAERAVVRELGTTCHTPVGVHYDGTVLRGFAGLPDGSEWVLDEVAGPDASALTARMLAVGAGDILRRAEALA